MVSWPGEAAALLLLLVLSSTGGLTGAILSGWREPTLCDADYCRCDAVKSKVTCNCRDGSRPKEIILQSNGTYRLPPTTSVLQVENCLKVTVTEYAFDSLVALRHIEIQHIRQLIIHGHAFNWNHKTTGFANGLEAGLSIVLKNASLPELPSYAFEGRHTSIMLQKLDITVIRPFSFSNFDNGISLHQGNQGKLYLYPEVYYNERTIQIMDCDIGSVESLAFRKFSAAEILWVGGRVGAFHQRAMLDMTLMGYDLVSRGGVTRPPGNRPGLGTNGGLRMENLHIGRMESSAMYLTRLSSIKIFNVTFIVFENGAIRALVDSPVFRNCYFGKLSSGGLLALTPDRGIGNYVGPSQHTVFSFENNTISKFENASLLVHPAYSFQAQQVRIDRACLCSSLWRWTLTMIGHISPGSDKDSTIVHSEHPPPPEASALYPALQCRPDDGDKYLSFSQVEKQMCKYGLPIKSYSGIGIVIIVVLACLGLAILVTLVAIFWIRRKRRKGLDSQRQGKAYIGVPTNERQRKNRQNGACTDEDTSVMINGSGEPRGKEYMVVMPDLRTYRETELHVIVERAEPLPMDANKIEDDEGHKSQLLENEDYPDAEKTSL